MAMSSNVASLAKGPSIPVSHTAAGAEGAFTGVNAAFPRTAKLKVLEILATSAFLVQVQGNGSELLTKVVAPNVVSYLDVSSLPPANSLTVNFEGQAAGVCVAAVYYQ